MNSKRKAQKQPSKKKTKKRVHKLPPEERAFIKSFLSELKDSRQRAELTLEQTEELGYRSWRHWQEVEGSKGEKDITLTTIYRMAKALGKHPADLLKKIPVKYLK